MAGYTVSPLGIINGKIGNYGGLTSSYYTSILSSYSSDGVKRKINKNTGFNGAVLSDKRHSNEVYDISTSNIIDKLKDPKTQHLSLGLADFAYLKDFGVYPNNRLMVCRRYPVPVIDDLYSATKSPGSPLSTVLAYVPEGDDFIKFSFNEEWEDANVSFRELLNSLGNDFGMKGQFQMGDILEGAVNVIPLPGATLLLQRKIMQALGFISENEDSVIPQGDPNLIKQAMNRSLVGEDKDGSGLKCKFSITLKTVYEQKFIQGVDPTLVFMDILNNLLNLGTSNATFYLGKQTDSSGRVTKYLNDFMSNPFDKIKEFIESLITAMGDQLTKLDEQMKKSKEAATKKGEDSNIVTDTLNLLKSGIDGAKGYVKDFISAKYKVKFLGIINALTGGPSTPWHITIGNPLRPIFCSGDMLCDSVEINMGPQLSFNDLPTFIEATITLKSARNLGLQEIFAKFNCGGIRVTEGEFKGNPLSGYSNSYWNSETFPTIKQQGSIVTPTATGNYGFLPTNQSTPSPTQSQSKVAPISSTSSITPLSNSSIEINPDINSLQPILAAGTNLVSTNIRTNSSQDGSTSQLQKVTENINSGVGSSVIDQKNNGSTTNDYTYQITNTSNDGVVSKNITAVDSNNNITYNQSATVDPKNSQKLDQYLIDQAKKILNK